MTSHVATQTLVTMSSHCLLAVRGGDQQHLSDVLETTPHCGSSVALPFGQGTQTDTNMSNLFIVAEGANDEMSHVINTFLDGLSPFVLPRPPEQHSVDVMPPLALDGLSPFELPRPPEQHSVAKPFRHQLKRKRKALNSLLVQVEVLHQHLDEIKGEPKTDDPTCCLANYGYN